MTARADHFSRMRLFALAMLMALPATLVAQGGGTLSRADSALVGRILLAEDRRDSSDTALAEGARHSDARVRMLAQRARGRIGDPRFATRDSIPTPPPAKVWPEPAWRLRYRALAPAAQRRDCEAFRAALADSAWHVRLRAADLAPAVCPTDEAIVTMLRQWIDAFPPYFEAARRDAGGVSWHGAAHAIVALARLRPDDARARLSRLATHREWRVRMYAARAAAFLSDTMRLRALARDPDDNVKEAAIEALSKLTGHADDAVFLAALEAKGAQAVRAAAIALKGSPRSDVPTAATAAFEKWVARANDSERDARIALLDAAGRPASDDRPPQPRFGLPTRAVALALGEDVRLRVTMSAWSGGGSFVVRLRGDVAPIMAARILALANEHYYDRLTWHRVEPDFVIQGLSPSDNEYVGYLRYFRDELGSVHHVRGTVAMSTRGHDTGDAQWFVNLKDNLRLDRDYTVFAEVIEGIDVVDGVLEGDVVASIEEMRGAPRLSPGARIEVYWRGAPTETPLSAVFLRSAGDSLFVQYGERRDTAAIGIANIQELRVYRGQGRALRRRAWVGSIAGAALGIAVGITLGAVGDKKTVDNLGGTLGATALMAGLFAVPGTLIGALTGVSVGVWDAVPLRRE
jgi:cyclophilin family peptidyl-prolyl cis-trans isomerase